MIRRLAAILFFATSLWLGSTPSLHAGLMFNLEPQGTVGSTALFGVSETFSGSPGDTVDAINLSVSGSNPALVGLDPNGGLDFGRFLFSAASPVSFATPFSAEGAALLIFDPSSPLTPSAMPILLGTLSVDFSGLESLLPLVVSLNGGFPEFATDASGSLGGVTISSFAAEGQIQFAQPDGVPIQPVPEPATLTLMAAGGVSICGFLWAGRRRGSRQRGAAAA